LILAEARYLQGVAAVAVTAGHDRDWSYTFLFAAFLKDSGDKRRHRSSARRAFVVSEQADDSAPRRLNSRSALRQRVGQSLGPSRTTAQACTGARIGDNGVDMSTP
jgi:hypothetical protein